MVLSNNDKAGRAYDLAIDNAEHVARQVKDGRAQRCPQPPEWGEKVKVQQPPQPIHAETKWEKKETRTETEQ